MNNFVVAVAVSTTTTVERVCGSVERVVLVDGARLADLMIEHEVGVKSRLVRVPKIDSDYFEE